MKENKIFWKVMNKQHAKEIILCLNDRYLNIELVERKNNRIKKINKFDTGCMFSNFESIEKQIDFINDNNIKNSNQFYIIKTI